MLEAQDMKLTHGQQVRQTAFFMALQSTGYNEGRSLDTVKDTAEQLEKWLWDANTKQQAHELAKAIKALQKVNTEAQRGPIPVGAYEAAIAAVAVAASPFV